MLKIKDNVDLKELEKFGFEYYKTIWASDSTPNNEYILVDRFINIDKKIEAVVLQVYEEDRELREVFDTRSGFYCRVNEKRIDTLYDLIKANLVEKVDDKMIEDLLNYLETTSLEPHDDYTSEFTYKEQKKLYNYIKNLQKENQELKNQLEKSKNRYINRLNNLLAEDVEPDEEDFYFSEIENKANAYDKLLKKQEEFIKYLEDMLDDENDIFSVVRVKDVLQKYKSIIGDNKE